MSHLAFLTTPAPAVALGIEAGRVSAIALSRAVDGPVITARAIEALPPGAVVPALTGGNIRDRKIVIEAVGVRARRIALVLPDPVAKVSILKFEKVPSRQEDLDQLIRFHVRKTAPFQIEDARLSYVPGSSTDGGGREFVVVLARRDVVEEYEAVAAGAGAQAGLVDLATLNVINMVLRSAERPVGDWLLVHVTPDYATIAILRGEDLIFFRNRGEDADPNLADLVHQTAMYYEDRLGGTGFERVLLAGGATGIPKTAAEWSRPTEELRRGLEARLGLDVACLDGTRFARFTHRIRVEPELFVAFAPLIGLLDRQAGAA